MLARVDIELIQPDCCSCRSQILGELQHACGIVARIAEENVSRNLCFICQQPHTIYPSKDFPKLSNPGGRQTIFSIAPSVFHRLQRWNWPWAIGVSRLQSVVIFRFWAFPEQDCALALGTRTQLEVFNPHLGLKKGRCVVKATA